MVLLFGMRLLFILFAASLCALLWAAVSGARHIRTHRNRASRPDSHADQRSDSRSGSIDGRHVSPETRRSHGEAPPRAAVSGANFRR